VRASDDPGRLDPPRFSDSRFLRIQLTKHLLCQMSSTMEEDSRHSPVLSPPPTEFPYPKAEIEKSESDDTPRLSHATHKEPNQAKREVRVRGGRSDPPRPDLKLRRVVTERPKQVGHRASIFGVRRRVTGGEAIKQTLREKEPADDGSTSPSSTSSSDDDESLRKSWPQPDYQNISMSRLNQIHRRVRHRAGSGGQSGRGTLGDSNNESMGNVRSDGRLAITVKETVNSGYLAKALGLTLQHHLRPLHKRHETEEDIPPEPKPPISASKHGIPCMNIVIMVIGSRGDIQPFVKIGQILKEKHGHRVRIATHPAFKEFVQNDIGLEFFSVGGDPSELMAFMVKNPGLIPSMETVRAGEIGRRRESMFEMFQGFWHACVNATDDEKDVANLKMMGGRHVSFTSSISP
jgi:Glycosyltransferase family 28 N-terminal domain